MLGNGNGILAAFFCVDGHVQILAKHLQLCNSSRPVYVGCYQHGVLALLFQLSGQLGCRRRFTGALQTNEHDDRRRVARHGNTALRTAQELRQFIADDLDDRLGCVQAAEDFFAYSLFADALDKILGDGKVDIRFQEGAAHLFQRFVYIFFCQFAFAAQLFKGCLKSFGKTFECHEEASFVMTKLQLYTFQCFPGLSCFSCIEKAYGLVDTGPHAIKAREQLQPCFIAFQCF